MSREEPDGPEPEAAAGESPFAEELGEDEPPGEKPDRPRAGPALGPRSSLLFASLDAAVEGLQQRVQDVLGRLNSGREEAHTELSGVRGSLLLKVSAERPPRSLPSFPPGRGGPRYSARLGGTREAEPGRGGSCGARPGGAPRSPAGAAAAASGPASSGPRCPLAVPLVSPPCPHAALADGGPARQLRPALTRRSVATATGAAATGAQLAAAGPGRERCQRGRAQLPPGPGDGGRASAGTSRGPRSGRSRSWRSSWRSGSSTATASTTG
ncbi:synaptonemal complex central element protein 2 isoform X1 [Agelaius tricolor]|uniref:synaptonemal complex central element protein 2 isoform X1 n=1 Tax=Agelaius tricolor TaxID=9191 RepID=UPI0039F22859